MFYFVSYKPDRLLGWSFVVILLILGSLYALYKLNLPVDTDMLVIDGDLAVTGMTLLVDIVHGIYSLIKEHIEKKNFWLN